MKKLLLVIMALCIVFTAGSVLAEDYTQDAFDSFTYMVRDENLDMREDYPDAFQGKAVFGLYYDLFSDPLEISSVSIDDADWAFLIYAEETGSEGEDVLPIRVMIFAVDAKNAVFYRPYELDTRETILENDGRTYDLGPSIRGWDEFMLYPEWRKANAAYDDAYRMALQYLKDEKYFSAWEAFSASEAEDAEERAAACIQPWPRALARVGQAVIFLKFRSDHFSNSPLSSSWFEPAALRAMLNRASSTSSWISGSCEKSRFTRLELFGSWSTLTFPSRIQRRKKAPMSPLEEFCPEGNRHPLSST